MPFEVLGWGSATYFGALAFVAYAGGRSIRLDTRTAGLVIGGLVLTWALCALWNLACQWLCFRRLALANKVMEITIADDGIHFVTSVSTGTVSWQAIERVIENKRGLYLAVSKLEAVLIPRRAVSDADFSRMRHQIEQRLGPKKS